MAISYVSEKTWHFNVVPALCSSDIGIGFRSSGTAPHPHSLGQKQALLSGAEAKEQAILCIEPDRAQRRWASHGPALKQGLGLDVIHHHCRQVSQQDVSRAQTGYPLRLCKLGQAIQAQCFFDLKPANPDAPQRPEMPTTPQPQANVVGQGPDIGSLTATNPDRHLGP
jgi:hypothetical protein